MTEHTKFRICQDRCPEDYGYPETHAMIVDKIEQNPLRVYKAAGCLGICNKLGGVNSRPVGGIGNFEEITSVGVREGVFAFNESGQVTRLYLDKNE